MNLLITGSSGQLGWEIQQLAIRYPDWQFTFADRKTLNLENENHIREYLRRLKPDVCINAAAYTAVDKAESEQEAAFAANATAPKIIAETMKEWNGRVIQISTDYLYHHTDRNTPYQEGDEIRAVGVYARSKAEGDKNVLEISDKNIVVRTSWVYSTHGNNFVKSMLRFGAERPSMRIVYDQIGTPTYAKDLAAALLVIAEKIYHEQETEGGIFHYSNEGVTTWFDFAHAIFEIAELKCAVTPITTSEYPTPAQRPHWSVMSKQKIKNSFGLEIPHWRDSLKKCWDAMNSNP